MLAIDTIVSSSSDVNTVPTDTSEVNLPQIPGSKPLAVVNDLRRLHSGLSHAKHEKERGVAVEALAAVLEQPESARDIQDLKDESAVTAMEVVKDVSLA
jgi:hypothetical protein